MKNLFESQKFYFLTRQPENTKSMNILVESRELSRQEAREHKINGQFIGCPEIKIGERRAQRQPHEANLATGKTKEKEPSIFDHILNLFFLNGFTSFGERETRIRGTRKR